jgi:hypothetical protein
MIGNLRERGRGRGGRKIPENEGGAQRVEQELRCFGTE